MRFGTGGGLGQKREGRKGECGGDQGPLLGGKLYPEHDQEPWKGF